MTARGNVVLYDAEQSDVCIYTRLKRTVNTPREIKAQILNANLRTYEGAKKDEVA